MSLAPGARLGPYEIVAAIGAGGMGEVYRARDTRLNRDVAIKILPEMFVADAERVARFQREAEILASLNHPNIAQIHGLEEVPTTGSRQAATRALVLELVDGPTLADRIARGPLPLDDALPIARQIAEALEAAHERGIIHRDLKPANIKVRADGTVKVLDFGLAKLAQPSDSGLAASDMSLSPTVTSPALATHAGMILGTAAYMSPEQAKGKPVDKRADLWAFGCVLYEMLTGKRVFQGEDVSDTLAEILKSDPDWRALPAGTPAPVRQLLRRCLSKDPRTRLSDAAVARLEIHDALNPPAESAAAAPAPASSKKQVRLAWAVAIASLLVAAATVAIPRFRTGQQIPSPPAGRFAMTLPTPAYGVLSGRPVPVVSPDGRSIVYMTFPGGPGANRIEIWIRTLDTLQARPIPGAGPGAVFPFWSPDGAEIGFFMDGKLKRIGLEGGAPETVCDAPDGIGGSWNRDGIIIFGRETGGIQQVPAKGGEPRAVTNVNAGDSGKLHVFPQFLPDGRRFIYLSRPDNGIHLASLDSPDTRELFKADSQANYVPPGYLLFVRQGTLLAQSFDAARGALAGAPVQLATQIAMITGPNMASFSASDNGVLAYKSLEGTARPTSTLVWLNRAGQKIGEIPGTFDDRMVSLSRAATYLALDRFENASSNVRDVWTVDHRRGTSTRLTFDPTDECCPIWSPDGRRIVFPSNRDGTRHIYEISPDSLEPPTVLLKTPFDKYPKDWSRDGRFIAFESVSDSTARDIWLLPLFGDRAPIPVVGTPAEESSGRFSPDGKWIAYVSNQSGRYEIYVQSLVDRGRRRLQVSADGGYYPRWRGDGREIFYVSPDRRLMAVTVDDKALDLQLGLPKPLFELQISDPASQQFTDKYDVMPDGQKFLVIQTLQQPTTADVTVVMNWTSVLKK